jgi:predicted NAD-dependent protein-ADP-ribosyltransferase YbiA (DUF1768 family)
MENQRIFIYNPNDVPFGILSNLYPIENFSIEGDKYRNINNYIYSFFGISRNSRELISKITNQSNVYNNAWNLYQEDLAEIKQKEVEKAYQSLFKIKSLRKRLIATGNSILIFRSDDISLGVNSENAGSNFIGKYLMSLRKKLSEESIKEKVKRSKEFQEDQMYKAYIVYNGLKDKLLKENDDLKGYEGKNVDEIIVQEGYSFYFGGMSKDFFIEYYSEKPLNENVQFVKDHPEDVVDYVKKINLREMRNDLLRKSDIDLIKSFIIVKKIDNGMEMNYKELEGLILKNLDHYKTYLPMIIRDQETINHYTSTHYIPTESEIIEAESKVFSNNIPVIDLDEIDEEIPVSTEKVINFYDANDLRYGFLSPYFVYGLSAEQLDKIHLLKVDGNFYPSVYHYLLVVTVAAFSVFQLDTLKISNYEYIKYISKAHSVITLNIGNKDDPNNYNYNFSELDNAQQINFYNTFMNNLNYRLRRGLDYKFSRIFGLSQILVDTKDADLIYGDFKDIYLGGDMNLLGKKLMEFRDRFQAQGYIAREVDYKSLKLIDFINPAPGTSKETIKLFTDWVMMRLNNVIFTLQTVLVYLNKNVNVRRFVSLTPELAIYLLEGLYRPCRPVLLKFRDITNVPVEVFKKLDKELKKYNIGPKGISVIWSYIYGLMQTAKEKLGDDSKDLHQVLEYLKFIPIYQNTKVSCDGIFKDDIKNCALYAIRNIIRVVQNFIKDEFQKTSLIITESDFKLPIDLISGKKNIETEGKSSEEDEELIKKQLIEFFPELKKLEKYNPEIDMTKEEKIFKEAYPEIEVTKALDISTRNKILNVLNKFLNDISIAKYSNRIRLVSHINLFSDYQIEDYDIIGEEEEYLFEKPQEIESEEGILIYQPQVEDSGEIVYQEYY